MLLQVPNINLSALGITARSRLSGEFSLQPHHRPARHLGQDRETRNGWRVNHGLTLGRLETDREFEKDFRKLKSQQVNVLRLFSRLAVVTLTGSIFAIHLAKFVLTHVYS